MGLPKGKLLSMTKFTCRTLCTWTIRQVETSPVQTNSPKHRLKVKTTVNKAEFFSVFFFQFFNFFKFVLMFIFIYFLLQI